MKFSIYFFLFAFLGFYACSSDSGESEQAQISEVETAQVSLEVLQKNNRIKTGEIQSKEIARTIQCTGKIEIPPTAINSVHSKISGQLTFLKYLPGDFVKKGTLLATVQNPQLVERQRQLLETKANLDFARKDFERKKTLSSGNAVSSKVFDETQNKFELLSATYKGLKAELKLLGVDVDRLEQTAEFISSINVYAKNSGYIHKVLVNGGQMITPEQPLMILAGSNNLYLELQVLSKDIAGLQRGQKVHFNMPSNPTDFSAEIYKISPVMDKETGMLTVHCKINHPSKNFTSGIFVNARIEKGIGTMNGLPMSGVVKEGDDYFAFKIENEIPEKVKLSNASVTNDFVVFDEAKDGTWIVEGAYYVE